MSSEAPGDRPRPQYGEYSTYDEQQARMGVSPAPAAPVQVAAAPVVAPVVAERRPHPADRIVTVLLLVFGLVNVASSVPALLDYRGYVDTFIRALGVDGALADPAAGAPWGVAAAFVLIVGLVGAALLSRMSLRRGRVTFWIPIVAGIVVNLVSAFLAIVPILNDPALWSALQSSLLP